MAELIEKQDCVPHAILHFQKDKVFLLNGMEVATVQKAMKAVPYGKTVLDRLKMIKDNISPMVRFTELVPLKEIYA